MRILEERQEPNHAASSGAGDGDHRRVDPVEKCHVGKKLIIIHCAAHREVFIVSFPVK